MRNKKYAVFHTQIQINEMKVASLNCGICVCIDSDAKELLEMEALLQEIVKHPCKMWVDDALSS